MADEFKSFLAEQLAEQFPELQIDLRRPRYYAPDGEPMTLFEWAEMMERRLEDPSLDNWWRHQTEISAEVHVSTVWLGLDHSFLVGPPLYWETMIFGGEHDLDCWRYPSRESALDDHERIVRAIRAGEDPLG